MAQVSRRRRGELDLFVPATNPLFRRCNCGLVVEEEFVGVDFRVGGGFFFFLGGGVV